LQKNVETRFEEAAYGLSRHLVVIMVSGSAEPLDILLFLKIRAYLENCVQCTNFCQAKPSLLCGWLSGLQ